MNFKSTVYLPDSWGRIEHLRKIIAGRPVIILAAGPSIMELEERICELKNTDICYFGLNNFSVQETQILRQIDKHTSIIMDSCRESIPKNIDYIIGFLNRDEDNMFISSFWRNTFELLGADFDLNQFISNYNKKNLFFSLSFDPLVRIFPDNDNPLHFNRSNSLEVLIQLAIIGKASKIVIFGADGYCEENHEEYYYRQNEYGVMPHETLIEDTHVFNASAPISIKNVYKTYNLDPIEILNCSEKSFLTPFSNVSYDVAFECLITGKKFNRTSDLRVPKVSIISHYLNNTGLTRDTIENISNQSYTNYEHIIIYNEDDDKIHDIKQQFPQIRWVPEKIPDEQPCRFGQAKMEVGLPTLMLNLGWIPAIKKGISAARGDYIFQCSIGDGYLNEDWICSCVEVLENDPDISLVWGLSENIVRPFEEIEKSHFFERPPINAKNYIYFWLKKKIVFPKGNVCVRKKVLEECLPSRVSKTSDEREAWLAFNYRFNVSGYQPVFVPKVVDYCKITDIINGKSRDPDTQNLLNGYYQEIDQYKKQLIEQKLVHHYRDGSDKLLPDGFNYRIFLFFIACEFINKILPDKLSIDCEEYLDYWMINQWKILKIEMITCWHRLIKNPFKAMRLRLAGRVKRKQLNEKPSRFIYQD